MKNEFPALALGSGRGGDAEGCERRKGRMVSGTGVCTARAYEGV